MARRTEEKFTAAIVPSAESEGRHCFAQNSRVARDAGGSLGGRKHERVRRRMTGQCPTTGQRLVDAVAGDQRTDRHHDTDIDVRVTSQAFSSWAGGWCKSTCKASTGNVLCALSIFLHMRETGSLIQPHREVRPVWRALFLLMRRARVELVQEDLSLRHVRPFYFAQPDARHSAGKDHLSQGVPVSSRPLLISSGPNGPAAGPAWFPRVGFARTGDSYPYHLSDLLGIVGWIRDLRIGNHRGQMLEDARRTSQSSGQVLCL